MAIKSKTNVLFAAFLTLLLSISVCAQNIQISSAGNPTEPSIMMDPNNPDILVAGSNLNYYYTSSDGGASWNVNTLTSSYGVWGDPVIDIDTLGHFYFTHLSNTLGGNWIDRIVCQKSTNGGSTWSDGSYTGLNGTKAQDKQWTIVDRSNNNIYMTWTEFDAYGSFITSDSSRILFSKSLDQGNSWSTPIKINQVSGDCIDEDNTVEGATPAIGPSGEVYVAWTGPNGIVFNRSLDQGNTWLAQEILVDPMPGGWDFDIPGLDRANGLPITKCDLSGGPNHGTIYINWSDQRNGSTDTDIWLTKSINGGDTWSAPVRVNNDSSNKHQFFTWMDIDQTNGHLYFIFYDRRAYADNQTDVYMGISSDGGSNFQNRKISDTSFTPTNGVFFGDYNNIVAHNDIVRPIWTRHNAGQLSIWTDVTPLSEILSLPQEASDDGILETSVFPNPTNNLNYISFKLHKLSKVKIDLIDSSGRLIVELTNEKMDYGKYVIPIDMSKLNLSPGTYYYKLAINEENEILKTILIK
jgi:hypothetical protein